MLCVRAGGRKTQSLQRGSVEVLELPRGFASFPIEKDLRYDPLFARHGPAILSALRRFRPDVVHITGPSELGMLGAFFAHRLGIPLAASWHTNVHEYAARRAHRLLPAWARPRVAHFIQEISLSGAALFYKSARLLFAPNPELCSLLAQRTGRPCLLMTRGIDAGLFSPRHRTRPAPEREGEWRLGYVGRLSVEKNVFLLPVVADELTAMGVDGCRFVIVGHGKEDAALRAALPSAIFTGVLQGEALAESYSDMDLFLFPSHTDTFGNVVLEAMASGVAAVVTPSGGPAYIVRSSSGGGCVSRTRTLPKQLRRWCGRPTGWQPWVGRHAPMRKQQAGMQSSRGCTGAMSKSCTSDC